MSTERSFLAVYGEDGSRMTWPNPSDPTELEWRLRYQPESITREDQLALASLAHAYRHLITMDSRTRQMRVMQIRAAAEGVGRG